ncbi:uncharacterized protein LOC135203577 [Macrobrachium nipponense]|uniref:uncharacterized protein LOC135203577 n=1 Tax=Macrobrachium nipponense TaxID=159736 RepID=UPI0030C8C7F4
MKGDVPNNSDGKDLLANEGSFDKIPDVFNEDVYSSIENLCIGCLGNHLEPSDSLSSCIYLVCNNASDERNTLYSKNLTKTDGIQQLQGSIISIDKNKSAEPSKGKIKNKVKWLPYGKVTARKSTKIHKEKVESKGKGLRSLEAVKKSSKTAGKYAGWSKAVNGKSHEVKTPPCTKVVRKSRRFSGSSSPVWSSNELNASTPVKRRHEGSLAENGGCISVPHSSPGRVSPNLEIFEKQGSKVSRKTLIPCVDLNSSGWITSVNYSNAYKDGRNDQKISIISSEETIENAASVKEVEPATSIKYSKPYDSGRKRPVDGTTHNFSSLSKEYETKDSLSKEYETKDSHQSEPPSGVIQFSAAGFMERSRASENIFHDITLSEETVDKNLTEPFTVNRHLKGACVSGQRNVVNYKALVNSVEDPVENHCSKVTALNRVSICSKTFSRVDTPGVSTAARGIERTQDKYPMLDSYKGNNIDKETSFIISHNCPSNLAAEFPENPDIESLSSKGICSCSMTSSCKSLENVLTPVSWLHTMSKRATEFYASKLENLPGHTIGKNEKEKSELINAKSNDLAFGEKGKIFDSILIGQQPVTCPESTSPEFVNVMDECGSMHLDNDLSTVTAFQLSDYCLNDGDNEYGKINSSSAMNVVSGKYKQNKFKTNNFPLLQDAVSSANFPVISEKEDSEVISVKGNNFDINEKEISGSLLISQQPRSFKESMDLMDECRSIHTDIDSSTLTVCDEFNVHYGTDDDYGYGNNSSSDMSMVSVNYKQNEGKTDNFPLQDTVPSANFPVISDKEESEVISVKGNNFVIGEKEISGSLLISQQPHSSKESVDLMDECGSVHTDSVCSTLTACNEFSHYGTDDNNECGKISSSSAMNVVSVNCKQNEPKTNHGVTWSSYGTDHAGVSMGKNNSVKLSKGAWAPLRNENSSRGCKGAVSSRIRRGPCIYRMFEYPPDQKILFNAIGLCCNVEQLVINRFQHNQDFLRILGRGSPDLGETLDHQKHYPWRILSYHAIKSRSRGIIEDSSTLKTTLSPYKLKEVSVRLVDIAKSIPQLLSKKASIRVKFRKKQEVDREFIPNLNSPVVFHGDHLYCKQSDIDMNTKKLQLLDTSGRKIMVSIIKTSKINTHENKKEGTHVTGVGSTLPHLNKDCFSKMSNSINPEREKSSCQIIDENNQTNRKCMSSKGSQPTTSVIHKISVTTNKDLNKRFESTFLHNYSSYGRNLRKMNEIPYRSQRPKLPSDQTHRVVHHVDTTLDGITQNRKGVMMINKENENTLPNTHRSNMNISMNTDTWNKNCTTIRSDLKDNSLLEKYPEENSPDKDSQEENSTGNRKSREFQSENSMGGRQSWKENIVKVRDSQEENFLIPRDSQENMDEIYSNEKNWVLNESFDENCMVEKDFQDGNGMIEREVHQGKSAVGSNSCENNVQKDIVEKGSQDDKLPLKRGSQNNSFAGDCHLKMPPEFLIMRGKKASPLKHSSKLQENDPASKCCLENKNKSKVGARGDIFCLNASSHTKSVPISSHIVNFCSKPQAIGTCSELEIFSICSEPQVVGTHSEPQIIGTHSEPSNCWYSF